MRALSAIGIALLFGACQPAHDADYIIQNGEVFLGDDTPSQSLAVAIKDGEIIFVGKDTSNIKPAQIIDASGLYVLPGFIDPHTHSLGELTDETPLVRQNRNYQFQGVTTVINGNDGYGEPGIARQAKTMTVVGIGTNTALFIGHGALRQTVMGGDDRPPTDDEFAEMQSLIRKDMEAGALGLSTGLFYAPGSFAHVEDLIALSKTVAQYGGIYDSHIRDEATYNIGLEAAVDEVIHIAREANIHGHIAHIKALGVDVWGKSDVLIANIEAARAEGLSITADQYPWQASGTRISNALLPRWVKAGTEAQYMDRLSHTGLLSQIRDETAENLRKRGGPEAVLITQDKKDWQGKTLADIAAEYELSPVDMAIEIARQGDARIASFNMNMRDIENFMVQPWVMTSSDGSTGHPRKFASYPKKYKDYVVGKSLMPVESFFYRSSGMVADTFGLCGRGYLRNGYAADIAIIDPAKFAPRADFNNAELLSAGVEYLFVNGVEVISEGESQPALPGKVLKRCQK